MHFGAPDVSCVCGGGAFVAEQLFGAASNMGYGRRDMSAVVKAVEALSGPDIPD